MASFPLDDNYHPGLGGKSTSSGKAIPIHAFPVGSINALAIALVDGSGNQLATLTNNNAAPGANNLGVLPAIANAAVPSYTEGNQVFLSTDLSGYLRVKGVAPTGSAVPSNAMYIAVKDGIGNLLGLSVASQLGDAGNNSLPTTQYIYNGSSPERRRGPTVFKTLSAVAINTETTVWTPTSGKKFRLMGFILNMTGATGDITVKDNTAGTTIYIIPANTVGVVFTSPPMGNGILSAAANNVLTFTGTTSQKVSGVVFGTEE